MGKRMMGEQMEKIKITKTELWDMMFQTSFKAQKDCGVGLVQFVSSPEYKRLKQRHKYFWRKHGK